MEGRHLPNGRRGSVAGARAHFGPPPIILSRLEVTSSSSRVSDESSLLTLRRVDKWACGTGRAAFDSARVRAQLDRTGRLPVALSPPAETGRSTDRPPRGAPGSATRPREQLPGADQGSTYGRSGRSGHRGAGRRRRRNGGRSRRWCPLDRLRVAGFRERLSGCRGGRGCQGSAAVTCRQSRRRSAASSRARPGAICEGAASRGLSIGRCCRVRAAQAGSERAAAHAATCYGLLSEFFISAEAAVGHQPRAEADSGRRLALLRFGHC